jgi:pimeloyl-ACP methyl ester carboxylesterase
MTELNANKRGGGGWGAAGLMSIAALGAAWLVVRNQTARVEREHPPTGKFIDIDGVRLHYIEQGEGPVLVLLHGNLVMAEDFRYSGLLDKLAQSYRVIAFDRPGFGYTTRPRDVTWRVDAQARLLHQALQQLNASEYLVLGHSMGTQVAVAMGLDQPARVRGLMLLSGYYYPGVRLDVPLAALPALPVIGDVMRHTVSPLFGRVAWPLTAKAMFAPGEVPDSFRQEPPWMALRPSQVRATAAEAALMVPGAAALEGRYAELEMPLLIMAGQGDRVVDPEAHSGRLHKTLPDSELIMLPGLGHMLPHLAQEDIASAVDRLASRARLAGLASDADELARRGRLEAPPPAM